MKSKLRNFTVGCLAGLLAFNIGGTAVCHAAESDVTLEFSDIDLKITIPEKYDYVIDKDKSYRDNIDVLGVQGLTTEGLSQQIKSTPGSYFEALYVSGDYFVESYIYYMTNDDEAGQLKDYSDKDIDDFGKEVVKSIESDYGDMNIKSTYEGVYKNAKDEPYIMLTLTSEDPNNVFTSSCLCTIVNNNLYYFYTKSYAPDADMDSLFEDTKKLVDGAEFAFDSSIKSKSVSIDWGQVVRHGIYGAVLGGIIGGLTIFIKKRNKSKEDDE